MASFLLPDELYGEYLGNRFQEDVDQAEAEEEQRRAEEERESEREFQQFLAEQQQQIAEAEAEQARVYEEAAQFEAERQAREQEELAQQAWEDQQREEELAAFQEQEYNQLLDEAFGEYEAEQQQGPDYGIVDESKFDSEEPWEAIGISTDFLEEKLGGDPVEIFNQQYDQEQLGQEPLDYLNEPEDPDTSLIESAFSGWQPEQEPPQAEEPLDYMEFEGQRYPVMAQAGGEWGTDVNFGSQGVTPVEEPAYEPSPVEAPPEDTPFVSPYEEVLEEAAPISTPSSGRPAGRDDFLPSEPTPEPIGTPGGAVYTPGGDLVPNQFASGLSAAEAAAACGPAAAVAFARAYGRNPTMQEALALARESGWTAAGGMNGAANQARLLQGMGIPAELSSSFDPSRAQNDIAGGRPVTISTPRHYFVADGYDPATGKYHVGNSGTVFREGAQWMTLDEIRRVGQGINGTLYFTGEPVAREGGRPAGREAESSPSLGAVVPSSANPDLVSYARQAAERAGIDQELFLRQITQESGWRTNVGSPAGAQGIAQIVPRFHPGVDTSDPLASLDYAANLMASHLRNYGGDYAKALAAYNAGAGAVAQYGGVPPFRETQNYVNIILGSGRPNLSDLAPGAPSLYESPGVSGQSEGTGGGYAATARGSVYEPPADLFGAGNIFGAANPFLSGARDRVGDALGGIGGAIGQTFSDYGSAVRGEGRDPNEWAGALSSFERNRPSVTGEPLRDYRGGEDRFDLFGALGNTAADALGQGQVDPFNLGGRLALTASNELGQGLQQLVGNAFGTAMQSDPYLARVREEQGPDAAWNAWWETYGSEMPQGLKGVIEQSPGLLAGMIGPGMVNNANRGVQAIGRGLEAVDIATAGPFAPLAALGYGNPSRQFDEIASALNPNQPFRSGLGPEIPMPEDSPSQIFLRQTSTTSGDDLLRGAGRQFGDFPEDMQDTLIRLQGQEPTGVRGTTYEEGNPLPPVNYQDVVNDVAKRRGLDPNELSARFADPANRGEGVRELATMDLRLQEVGTEIADIRARQARGEIEAADEFLLGEKNAEQLMLFNGIKGAGSEAGRNLNFLRMTYKLQRAEDESLQFTQAARVIRETVKEVEAGLRNGYIKPETARKVEDIAGFIERRLAGDDLPGTSLLDELSAGTDEAMAGTAGGGVAAPPKMSVSDRARNKVVIEGDPELDKVLKQKAPAEFKSITDMNWRQKEAQDAGDTRRVNEIEAERQDLLTKIKDKVYEEEINKLYREYPDATREDMVAMVDKQIIGRIRRNIAENVRGEPRFIGRMESQLDQKVTRALAQEEIASIESARAVGKITDDDADVMLRELSTRSGWHEDEVRKFIEKSGRNAERLIGQVERRVAADEARQQRSTERFIADLDRREQEHLAKVEALRQKLARDGEPGTRSLLNILDSKVRKQNAEAEVESIARGDSLGQNPLTPEQIREDLDRFATTSPEARQAVMDYRRGAARTGAREELQQIRQEWGSGKITADQAVVRIDELERRGGGPDSWEGQEIDRFRAQLQKEQERLGTNLGKEADARAEKERVSMALESIKRRESGGQNPLTDAQVEEELDRLALTSKEASRAVLTYRKQAEKALDKAVAQEFLQTIKDMRAATGQMTFMEGGMRGQPVSSELEKMLQQMSTLSTQAEQMAKQYRTSIAKARARKFLGKGESPPPELLQKLESIDIGNTREVNKLISDMNVSGREPGKFTQLLNQLNSSRAASMLTGTAQLTNVFGNAVMAGYGVGRTGVAALGERVAPIAGRGQPRQAHFDQVGSMMAEMVAAVPPSLKDAADTWTTGVSSHEIRDLGHHRADPIDFTIPGTGKKLAGFSTGVSLPGPIANIQIPTPKGVQQAMGPLTVGGAFKYANLNTVFRGLAATDDFTRSMNFNMALASEATRLAKQLSHDGRVVTEEELLLDIRRYPEMVKRARVEAERLTLQTPLEGWLIHANGLRKNPVGQFLLPFFNTLVNIQRIGLNMTPYGLINMKKAMDAGDFIEAANRRADVMIGTTLIGAGAVMAQANLITGAGPDNPQERQALMDTGWRPYSIQIAGNYFPLAVIGGAMAVPLVLGALTKEMVDRGRADGKWENATAGLLRDYLATMVDNSGLRTAGNLVALPYQPWRMESFIESQARSAVPYTGALGVLNRMFDPNIKDPEGAVEAIKSQLPYLRDQVPNRITRWGEEQNRSFSGPAALLPGSGSAAGPNSDIVVREISRLQSAGKNVLPRLQDGELKVPGRGDVDLTREQRNQLQTIAGVMAHKDLEAIMNQPSWSLRDADAQRGVINEVAGRAGNLARVTMAREQLGSTQPWKYRGVTDLQQEIDIDEAVRVVDAYMADRRRRPNEKLGVAQPSAEQMQLGRRYGNTNQQTAEYRRWRQEEERAGREQRAATQSNVEELLPYEIRQQNRRSAAATLQPVR